MVQERLPYGWHAVTAVLPLCRSMSLCGRLIEHRKLGCLKSSFFPHATGQACTVLPVMLLYGLRSACLSVNLCSVCSV